MSVELRIAMILFQLLCGVAESVEASTPQEREWFVRIVTDLETAPFAENAARDRARALVFIEKADDIKVKVNVNLLRELIRSKAPHRNEIVVQFILAAGRFVIDHPDGAPGDPKQNLAAFESCLLVYQKAVDKDATNKLDFFDMLIQKQQEKTLEEYVKQLAVERKPTN